MKEILANLAMIDLINYCTTHNVDCSGTHVRKLPRRFTYTLIHDNTGQTVATVTFQKHAVPTHFINHAFIINH